MSSASEQVALIDEALALRFAGGSVAVRKPSREALEDSALAWAQTCNSNLHALIDELVHGDTRTAEGALRGLESSVFRLRAVFAEMAALSQTVPECMK
jgi:hypothetical protein